MKIKTRVKAGKAVDAGPKNHNQTVSRSLKVKSSVKAGEMTMQHNQRMAKGLKVKTSVKAGPQPSDPGGGLLRIDNERQVNLGNCY